LGSSEFQAILSDEVTLNQLVRLTKLSKEDLEQVYSLLRTTDKVSRDSFIDAIRTEKRSTTERSVLRLEKRLINLQNAFDMQLGQLKAGVGGPDSNMPVDPRSVELMLEPMFVKFERSLEKRGSEIVELLAGRVSKVIDNIRSRDGLSRDRLGTSSLESSLARIEEQVEINARLLDRSRVECTIVSNLAKIEQQNIEIKKALFVGSDADSTIKSFLTTIEKQNMDIKKALFDGSDANSTIKSSLTKIEERLENGKGLEVSSELSSLESVMQRITQQLNSINYEVVNDQRQPSTLPFSGNVRGDERGGGQGQLHGTVHAYRAADVRASNAAPASAPSRS